MASNGGLIAAAVSTANHGNHRIISAGLLWWPMAFRPGGHSLSGKKAN